MAGPAQEMFAADRASRGLGIELLAAGDGAATVRMTVADTMVNGHGIAHGGFLFLLADSAFACACNSHGPVTVAAGAAIDFLTPARLGDTLTATAAERGRSGRSGIYDVTVRRGDEVVAEFRGRSRALRPTPPAAGTSGDGVGAGSSGDGVVAAGAVPEPPGAEPAAPGAAPEAPGAAPLAPDSPASAVPAAPADPAGSDGVAS